jgi:hypothetical protein
MCIILGLKLSVLYISAKLPLSTERSHLVTLDVCVLFISLCFADMQSGDGPVD